ncbi:MAG: ABC transporter permease [Synergistaceae bacterium]|nr:ABC transporter permease [Synergistaceae bacterium]
MNIPKLVCKNLLRRKGRFIFTLLGITIGMASFVALLSLGGNMRGEVTKQAGALGANLIITPKNWCAYDQISILTGESLPESLQYDVLDKVSAIDGITAVPYLTQKTAVQNNPVLVTGILPGEMKDFKGWELKEGDYFVSPDERAAVIGSSIANQFDLGLNDVLTIRGGRFPVKAILQATGSNDDASVYLPVSVVQEIYDVEGYISYIAAKVDDITRLDSYIAAVVDVANVAVTSDRQLLSSVLAILGAVNTTLQLIAGVALIAAAFGIVNTMMTATYERRREIGILRAIGAKSSAIFNIFLLESGLYGLLGGVTGVAAGFVVSVFAAPLIAQSDFTALLKGAAPTASLDASIVLRAILFSIVISIASGLYPAWKAAKLTPVEAISHYE